MKVFYIDIEEYKKKTEKSFLEQFNDIDIKNEKRFFEYTLGRYLVKTVAKTVYNLKKTDITLNEKGKPEFKNNDLFFNISHSKNIIIAGFDKLPLGIDIEYIKNRDLNKFSKYFKKDFKSLEEFYKFWTYKEALYKLGCKEKSCYQEKFKDKFYLTILSKEKTKSFEIEKF